jgi:hypothetical protein
LSAATDRVRLVRGALTPLALLAGLCVPASSLAARAHTRIPQNAIGVQLIGPPAPGITDALARCYITGTIAPGTTTRRSILVSNSSRRASTISIYTAAASIRGGSFAFATGRTQNALSRWTNVNHGIVHLAAGASAVETVTVRIPSNAPAGERYAVVWAAATAIDAASGVRLVNRVGVRMYLSVGPGGPPPVRFSLSRPTALRVGRASHVVVATVQNTGTRTIWISGELTLSGGPAGLRAGPFEVHLGQPLAPHRSRWIRVRLSAQLPRGPWQVQLSLQSGSTQHAAYARLTFP